MRRPASHEEHENAGIATRSVLITAAIGFVAAAVIAGGLYAGLQQRLMPRQARVAAQPAPIPPSPRLQARAPDDLAAWRSQKQSLLDGYAWNDPKHTTARIPIERAMQLYVRQRQDAAAGPHHACAAQPLRAPADLQTQVGIDQRLGALLPLETRLQDSGGGVISLRALLQGKPAVLVPTYYHCENLCDTMRAGIARAVAGSGLKPRVDFQVLLVSFDARESAADARQAQLLDGETHRSGDIAQWHFLAGADPAGLAALMHGIGFRYRFDARDGQFAHAAGAVVLSPRGKVTQYLLGVQFDPRTLRLSLVDAARGRIGNLLDEFILLCCRYDESTGRYDIVIDRILMIAGMGTALLLAALVALLLRGERRRGTAAGSMPP